MAGYYTESNYENAVLQLLNEGLGYTYVYGPDVERDYHSPLYEDVLLPALQWFPYPVCGQCICGLLYCTTGLESGLPAWAEQPAIYFSLLNHYQNLFFSL